MGGLGDPPGHPVRQAHKIFGRACIWDQKHTLRPVGNKMGKPGYRGRAGKIVIDQQRVKPGIAHAVPALFNTGIENRGGDFALVPGKQAASHAATDNSLRGSVQKVS